MRLYLSSFTLGDRPDELLSLLRGKKRAAVIVNAADAGPEERRPTSVAREIGFMASLGLEATDVDLRHYFGRQDELGAVLAGFDLLWVRGGNCFVLRRALRMSGADEIIVDRLSRDTIVYAGYSAAMAVLVPHMRGMELVDDPKVVPSGYDPEILWQGLNLLPYTVAPHYRSDHPESPMIEDVVAYFIDNHLPFIALRDGEAIVIDDDGDRVVG
ncbi:MAG: Type 1 glutamine amidotransferase-like domain-containing protein [Fimbriimonas sp.]|nr:Type 1 glutamine amidotransferase-like domain-containing protein [Fimbriimonas sp.]